MVELDDPYSLDLFIAAVHEVEKQCKQQNLQKALVDITKMIGSPSIIDRYETGVEISKCWGGIQVAAIATDGQTDFSAETVAVNRGANFRVFNENKAAFEWLKVDE